MGEFFRSRKFKIILLILSCILGLMLYAAVQKGSATAPSNLISSVVTPIGRFFSGAAGSISGYFNSLINANNISDENEQLKKRISALQKGLIDLEQYRSENEQLREMLEMKKQDDTLVLEPANVIARDSGDLSISFVIDKGSRQGIHYRDAVITAQGLVGVVTEVGSNFSKVTTILSRDVKVGAIVVETKDYGVVVGNSAAGSAAGCKIKYLMRKSTVQSGNLLITSGEGGLFPRNIQIGTIGKLSPDETGVSVEGTLKLMVDVKNVKSVFVAKDFPGKGEQMPQ